MSQQRFQPGREAEYRRPGKRMQRAIPQDERRARQFGRQEPIAKAELIAQRNGGRFLDEQRVRAGIDDEVADPFGLDDAAGARLAFENHDRSLAFRSSYAAGSPDTPPPMTGTSIVSSTRTEAHHAGLATACATSAARVRMNVGEVFSDSGAAQPDARVACGCGRLTSMSKRISVWSHTKPIGATSSAANPRLCPLADEVRQSGPSHGSGVLPALW